MEIEKSFSSNGLSLVGTLTIPDNVENPPACLFIGGSRPQTRDGDVDNTKKDWFPNPFPKRNLFLDEAKILEENNFASFRYDKRGSGKSDGNFNKTGFFDLIDDARNAFTWMKTLPQIDSSRIGILGQSEGAEIGLILASEDLNVSFLIRQGGPFSNLKDTAKWQASSFWKSGTEYINKMRKLSPYNYWVYKDLDNINEAIERNEVYFDIGDENWSFTVYLPWFREHYESFDKSIVKTVSCPVLILHGELDTSVQVIDAHDLEKSLLLAGNKNIVKVIFSGLDHSFRRLNTPKENFVTAMNQPLDPKMQEELKNWLKTL